MIGALKGLDKRVDHVKEVWSPCCPRYDFSHITDGSYDPEHLKHYYVVQLKLLGYSLDKWCDIKECTAFELERSYWAAREALRNEMSPEHQDPPTTTDGSGDTCELEALYEGLELQARCSVEQLEEAAEKNGLGILRFRRRSILQE